MKYYLPVGPGGGLFRVGLAVNGAMGSLVYWRASRRRGAGMAAEPGAASGQPRSAMPRPETWTAMPTVFEPRSLAGEPVGAMAASER